MRWLCWAWCLSTLILRPIHLWTPSWLGVVFFASQIANDGAFVCDRLKRWYYAS